MTWTQRFWTFVVLVVLPIGFVTGCWIKDDLEEKAFYREHKTLGALWRAIDQPDQSQTHTDWQRARKNAFFSVIPPGTSQTETLQKLASEKLICKQWNPGPPRSKLAFDCYIDSTDLGMSGNGSSRLISMTVMRLRM